MARPPRNNPPLHRANNKSATRDSALYSTGSVGTALRGFGSMGIESPSTQRQPRPPTTTAPRLHVRTLDELLGNTGERTPPYPGMHVLGGTFPVARREQPTTDAEVQTSPGLYERWQESQLSELAQNRLTAGRNVPAPTQPTSPRHAVHRPSSLRLSQNIEDLVAPFAVGAGHSALTRPSSLRNSRNLDDLVNRSPDLSASAFHTPTGSPMRFGGGSSGNEQAQRHSGMTRTPPPVFGQMTAPVASPRATAAAKSLLQISVQRSRDRRVSGTISETTLLDKETEYSEAAARATGSCLSIQDYKEATTTTPALTRTTGRITRWPVRSAVTATVRGNPMPPLLDMVLLL